MVAAACTGVLLGYLLGLRFRVFVLLPVELAAVAVGLAAGLCGIAGGMAALSGFALFSAGLQVSYAVALLSPIPARRTARHHVEA